MFAVVIPSIYIESLSLRMPLIYSVKNEKEGSVKTILTFSNIFMKLSGRDIILLMVSTPFG